MRHTLARLLRRLADRLDPGFPKVAYIKFDPMESVTSKMVSEMVRNAYLRGRYEAEALSAIDPAKEQRAFERALQMVQRSDLLKK